MQLQVNNIKLLKLKVVNVFIILLFIFSLLSIDQIRMRLFPIFCVATIIAAIKKNRKKTIIYMTMCSIVMLLYISFFHDILNKFKFNIVKPFYEKQANIIMDEQLSKKSIDIDYHSVKSRKSCMFLTQDNEYIVKKTGNYIYVYFPMAINFFNNRGYLYSTSITDSNMVLNRDILMEQSDFDRIDLIDEQWAYVFLY